MKTNLKVIKPIKGLIPGDILNYNNEENLYEINKITEDISIDKVIKKTLNITLQAWVYESCEKYYNEYLVPCDKDGNEIDIQKLEYIDREEKEPCENCEKCKCEDTPTNSVNNDAEIDKLNKRITQLENVLEQHNTFPLHRTPRYFTLYDLF